MSLDAATPPNSRLHDAVAGARRGIVQVDYVFDDQVRLAACMHVAGRSSARR